MADYTKLNSNIETLSLKIDDLLRKANNPPMPVVTIIDDQPSVDAVDAAITALIAKIDPPVAPVI